MEDYENALKLWDGSGLITGISENRKEVEKLLKSNPNSFFVLEINNTLVGTVIAGWDGRRGLIHHLAVDAGYRKMGLGKLLMNRCMEYYKIVDAVKVHLLVEKDNINAIEFYKSLNWVVREDLFVMTKTLRT